MQQRSRSSTQRPACTAAPPIHQNTSTLAAATAAATLSPPQSDFDVSEYGADDVHHHHYLPDLDSEPTSATDSVPAASQSSGIFSDISEEEEREGAHDEDVDMVKDDDDDDIDGRLSFGYGGSRTTFSRTSAERGQWKTNPMPYKPKPSIPTLALAPAPKPLAIITRKSEPTASRVATPVPASAPIFNRPISEPVFSAATRLPENENDHSGRAIAQNIRKDTKLTSPVPVSVDLTNPVTPPTDEEVLASPRTLPALSEDRESSIDIDIDGDDDLALFTPSSPLPPSSPPPLSPQTSPLMHSSMPPMSRSVSPIMLDYDDSSSMRGSSPLSELPDDDEDDELEGLEYFLLAETNNVAEAPAPEPTVRIFSVMF
ncbi:hypothetical protein D9619_011613 [Psilocybe cf. subviscida]|uniref:Uncharacterized protein n=1 Tax=Psilocybe cf. subviscida TaxID=2480587 RepID=A0A8H5BSB5_9AGAR|nr:hypothetical protein D9619_011613 [Psilocybe cf. subviscida]